MFPNNSIDPNIFSIPQIGQLNTNTIFSERSRIFDLIKILISTKYKMFPPVAGELGPATTCYLMGSSISTISLTPEQTKAREGLVSNHKGLIDELI